MDLRLGSVTFDCADPARLAAFWSEALGFEIVHSSADFVTLRNPAGRPYMSFCLVPEPKAAKNRVHVDFGAHQPEAEVSRLVGLGATVIRRVEDQEPGWTIMADPEGNEFCVGQHE